MLLTLTGIALQRTMMELRTAEVSRDVQQAFWLAEAGLDQAMVRVQNEYLRDGVAYTAPTSFGSVSFTLSTIDSEVLSPQAEQLTRQVTVVGTTATGRSAQLTATVVEQGALRGSWTEGAGMFYNASRNHPMTVSGVVRSGLGTATAIGLMGNVHHDGELQIGSSREAAVDTSYDWRGSFESWTYSDGSTPASWQQPMGQVKQTDSVYLGAPYSFDPDNKGTTTVVHPTIASIRPFPSATAPYPDSACRGHLTVPDIRTKEIADGDPLDLSPAGDGKIDLCLRYVNLGVMSSLVFRAPATLYVTGYYTSEGNRFAVNAIAASNLWAVPATDGNHWEHSIPNGVQFVVTDRAGASHVNLSSRGFSGSVYAPKSPVRVVLNTGFLSDKGSKLGHVVARELMVEFDSLYAASQLDMGATEGQKPAPLQPLTAPRLLEWNAN